MTLSDPPHGSPATLLPATQQWLPLQGRAEQLMLLLHGWGARPAAMAPLARQLRLAFPQAAMLAPEGFEPADQGEPGRQWFSLIGVTEANRPDRVAAVLPRLAAWVRAAQAATGLGPVHTALVGFSQGAILALELAQAEDGLAGRVLAFAGRYARLPAVAPAATTLHLLHGADDAVISAAQSRLAIDRLAALHGDATVDIALGVGHALPPALVATAIGRLQTHIPHRTWQAALGQIPGLAAMGQVPGLAARQANQDPEPPAPRKP